jgi:peptide/nickel transport system permease protein
VSTSIDAALVRDVPGHALRGVARGIARRLGVSVIVVFGAVTASFIALKSMPGDPVVAVLGGGTAAITPELRAQVTERYGLDQPVLVQYATYLGNVLRGDLGESYSMRQSVSSAIMQQLPNTMMLLLVAVVLAVVVAVVVSVTTAHRGRAVKAVFQGLESIGIAVPSFWLGIMLITVFAFGLRLFPSTGASGPAALVLPAIALAVPVAATLTQVMRDTLERTLDEPFIVSVRARGASESVVRVRHALRHSLVSAVTLVGWLSGTLIGGAVIVEQVFSRPGIGRMTFAAVLSKDLPLVLGIVIFAAIFYVIINTIVDLLYPIIDPRLRA